MKKALITGSTGFVGKNVVPILEKKFDVVALKRENINLLNGGDVRDYLKNNHFDIIFHCANPNPVKNSMDLPELMVENSLRMFINLSECNDLYEKMIYFGSGAEYDKTKEIQNISEEECFRSIPEDSYGFAKYIENKITQSSNNIYNLCLFGCFGPFDHESKFITHCIRCCLRDEPITIRQDCKFDYIHVFDLARIMIWFGYHEPMYHMYNISGCNHMLLSEIAEQVRMQMKSEKKVEILKQGFNHEYTANGQRFWTESGIEIPMTIEKGISLQIKWEKRNADEKKSC